MNLNLNKQNKLDRFRYSYEKVSKIFQMNRIMIFTLLFFIIFLSSCIPIDDLGNYWDQGSIDSNLEGAWKMQGVKHPIDDEYISFLLSGNHYLRIVHSTHEVQKLKFITKTLHLGNHKFLMHDNDSWKRISDTKREASKSKKKRSGGLTKYKIENKILYLYRLNEGILKKAIELGKIKGLLPKHDNEKVVAYTLPTITTLNEKSVLLIKKWANNEKNWKVEKYERIDNLETAIQKSKTYPTTKNTKKNTLVDINQPDLKYFAKENKNVLLRYLKASPEWKVFDERGEIICYNRNKSSVSLNGYQSKHSFKEAVQTRRLFRFAQEGGGAFVNEYNRDMTTVIGSMDGIKHLKLKSSNQGIESYLVIGENGLWFEFFEQTKKEERIYTRRTLTWLNDFLKAIRADEDKIKLKGYAPSLIKKDMKKKPFIEVKDSFQGGIFDVYAWINPRASGYVYLKAFDVEKGTKLSEVRLTSSSKEYTGWSNDTKELFYYNTHVSIYEGDWSYKYDARFELWFHPDDATPEKKLLEQTRQISGWQR